MAYYEKDMPKSTPEDAPKRPAPKAEEPKGDGATPLQKFGARFAVGLAEGLKAEGKRRADIGLGGAGFAEAFASGVQPLKEFVEDQDSKARSARLALEFKAIGQAVSNELVANGHFAKSVKGNAPTGGQQPRNQFDNEGTS